MKKTTAFLAAAVLSLGLGLGAMAQEKAPITNQAFNTDEMMSISGETLTRTRLSELLGDSTIGFSAPIPEAWMQVEDPSQVFIDYDAHSFSADYLPMDKKPMLEKLYTERDPAKQGEIYADIQKAAITLFKVMHVNPDQPDSQSAFDEAKKTFDKEEVLATVDKDSYVLLTRDISKVEGLNEQDKEILGMLTEGLSEFKQTLMLFPKTEASIQQEPKTNLAFDGSALNIKDLDGKAFDAKEFAKYDLTMVNVWSTSCGYCIEEMPDLAKLKDMLPKNVNLISVCLDGESEPELAKEILKASKATFTTLAPTNEDLDSLFKDVLYTPTTLFVDKNGQVVGEAIIGAPQGDGSLAEQFLKVIQDRLDLVK